MARTRNKALTREAILKAARSVLASDGPEALSLSKVANIAGVNRGTAYQHFSTRNELVKAAVGSVSEYLSNKIFGQVGVDSDGHWQGGDERPADEVVSGLIHFAVENPVLCRVWLFEVLSSKEPGEDPFFRQFQESIRELAETDAAQPGIDVEPQSVLMLAGYFLWPVWVDAHAKNKRQREAMAKRMRDEVLRLCLHGVLKKEKFPHLLERLEKDKGNEPDT